MRARLVGLVVALAACQQDAPPDDAAVAAPAIDASPYPVDCIARGSAEARAAGEQAERWRKLTEDSYAKALVDAGLTRWYPDGPPVDSSVPVAERRRRRVEALRKNPPVTRRRLEVDEVLPEVEWKRTLLTNDGQIHGEFARDERGKYVEIKRAPNVVAYKTYTWCGCDPSRRNDQSSPAPRMRRGKVAVYFPFDVDDVPIRRIEYEAREVATKWSGRVGGCD